MDAQIERVIAEVQRKYHKSPGIGTGEALRELAQRVLEIAAEQCHPEDFEAGSSEYCASSTAAIILGLASDGAQEKTNGDQGS